MAKVRADGDDLLAAVADEVVNAPHHQLNACEAASG